MLKKWQFIFLMAASVLACAVVGVNMLLFTQNRAAQQKVTGQQQFIQQSVQLESLYQQLIKSLAELSARHNDEQLRAVLSSQGISFSRNPAATAGAASTAPAPAKK